jgi:hypothetical protein
VPRRARDRDRRARRSIESIAHRGTFRLTLIGSRAGSVWKPLGAGAFGLTLAACTLSRPD